MIITHIYGGLGNQMFQYAVGRQLSLKLNVPLKFDISDFARYPLRKYELHHLNIIGDVASSAEVAQYKPHPSPLQRVLARWLPLRKGAGYVGETRFTFDPSIISLGDNHYLEGYWQSEKYFTNIADQIRQDFTPKGEPDGENARMLSDIKGQTAISVHVRRGDYVSNAKTNQFHGTTPIEYYQQAANRIQASVKDPTFYVFSDDPTWVQENIKFQANTIYVTQNGGDRSYEDLRLMRHCQHHIIANSTFSWWGAWLGEHTGQIVVAPKEWFKTESQDDRDLVPGRWLRI